MSDLVALDKKASIDIAGVYYWAKPHEDDRGFDRLEATMVPRWKESELSGDEWRWSIAATAYRKGNPIAREHGLSLGDALIRLLPRLVELEGAGYLSLTECAQPACAEGPTVLYRLTREFSRDGHYVGETVPTTRVRPFCAAHTHRGDCGREDNDDNYAPIAWMVDGEWTPMPPVDLVEKEGR